VPTTITRKFQTRVVVDATSGNSDQTIKAQDEITLPWRGTVGFAITPRQDLTIGFEYELRPYASAVYKDASGSESNPWLSASLMHLGAQYVPFEWLQLRVGVHDQAEVFQEEGAPIADEPIRYSAYSAGVGLTFGSLQVNFAYEYATLKYQDMWQTNVNLNRVNTHNIIAGLSYQLQ
jgi:opacity protein-like surface antigen